MPSAPKSHLLIRIAIPVAILAGGYAAWSWLGIPVKAPTPQPRPPLRLKTEHLELSRSDFPVSLESQGTVQAHHTTPLTAMVSGVITKINPTFEDGAFFEKGDILAELDPADLQADLTSAKSTLARSEAALAQEEASAKQARLNWEDIGYEEAPSPLVLRIPQLKEANANVTAAQAELERATRNLERAKIRAPFAGRVQSRLVGLGQSINGTTQLGEIFATDTAEVRLPLTPSQLQFINLPTRDDDPTLDVTLTDALTAPGTLGKHEWKAKIVRSEGTLDPTSRELFAIARIDDPFGLINGGPQLRIGQPVRASIQGKVLKDVFVLPRTALRGVNRVFLINRDDPQMPKIQRKEIKAIWSTDQILVIRDGLEVGSWLATSRLPYAPNGAPVEIIYPQTAAELPKQESEDS
ncbi:efflux RND transporter periplasmic adaptor subunit [Luteolibacter pohnpeiensis]|uniref:Efflux RND transporter periplasmic adaptor subunit n=1 Tax=Luteolibacter pohnpeiensis TaxID=454153 RepID=A0A934VQJ5_9BACT|nr:efflux RND transporter periplasmic adaptor subunit [Luteolibacter pohnpeiensis]MBK1882156.1 efflux RND transporter periplasmic adaptor subunit [Luteolibacter pohnpeiensis]